MGGFTELHLSDYYKVTSDAFNDFDTGRYRILSAGPELMFRTDDIIVALSGRALLNSTKNASFDFLGNLMGAGVAQGSLGLSVRMLF